MAAVTETVTDLAAQGGKFYARFGKREYEFNTLAEAADWASVDVPEIRLFLDRLLLQEWRRRNPAGNNPSLIEGVSATLELDGTLTPVRFSG